MNKVVDMTHRTYSNLICPLPPNGSFAPLGCPRPEKVVLLVELFDDDDA